MDHTATYSPEDNKLRIYPAYRLDKPLYERVRAAGFIWAGRQELFVAPMWTPQREDLALELCGEIGDEDKSLVERQEERAERFTEYKESRTKDAEQAHAAVARIADGIPLGQPILVGHHSERHARKDAERIENGMRKAVKMWDTAQYWKDRAAGALRLAKYKERPDVRARRIKGLEADLRKQERYQADSAKCLKFWNGELVLTATDGSGKTVTLEVNYKNALWFCNGRENISMCFPLDKYPRQAPASQYEGMMSFWSALGGSDGPEHAIITAEQARDIALPIHTRAMEHRQRWIDHLNHRIEYERAMLGESGGTETDKNRPEEGGGVKCWASPRGGWSYILKVNKVSVTVMDQVGGWRGTRTMPFDKCFQIMSKAEVETARERGELSEDQNKIGFYITKFTPPTPPPEPEESVTSVKVSEPGQAALFDGLRESLKAGVQTVCAPQLFPTPADLAARMAILAEIKPEHAVLEPSAGTGALIREIVTYTHNVLAIEFNYSLASLLEKRASNEFHNHDVRVRCADFLECNGDLGKFDRIVMNPPFENGADIKHIEHALTFLKPEGKLVAICANGPRQNDKLQPLSMWWEELPPDTFKNQGTGVRTVLLMIEGE